MESLSKDYGLSIEEVEEIVKSKQGVSKAQMEQLRTLLACDVIRIDSPCDNLFAIAGWKRNTRKERAKNPALGQWFKNGKPTDFNYLEEKVLASGKNVAELLKSAKEYRALVEDSRGAK